jgi:molybdopterin-guanine dinucleotide biosynthesis protein A
MATAAAAATQAITGAILAGGRGERVGGRDKGLIRIRGRALVQAVHDRLRPQVADILIVANRNAPEYASYGRVVVDRASGFRGPLAGIDAALAACVTPWLLTVPVDCPNLPDDLAARLLAGAVAAAAPAAAAFVAGRNEPLFAIYRREVRGAVAAALSADLPVWRWHDELGAARIDFSDSAEAFANLNTEQEIGAWEKAHG